MRRPHVPIALPIVIVVLLILGFVAMRLIPAVVPADVLNKNVLLAAIPFILIFIGILLTYIMLIVIVATAINDLVNPRFYTWFMRIIIACIIIGVLGMFQSIAMPLYTHGFQLVFIATLTYIMWSHVRPARVIDKPLSVDAPV
ncbi:MAG: hypothetical protein KDI07_10855 [Anaerolineae bacterium]|nr:hypothetical protein [Anaerolineae bacterium]MCB9133670.1 hypothetical protein [Anaerolineales bacterium]MCB0229323.1 hypothetical protein [Anaerolineae bacterium]MCB0236355.1 hypothetical protein [Anaerolineae bacterium]MCB0239711.1 hypothetical protein [Anaerolineae bacterium]